MDYTYNEAQLTSFLDQISWRLRLIEAQSALMAKALGISHCDPAAMTPAESVDLLIRATTRNDGPEPQSATREHLPVRSTPASAAA